jgi:hypothetical protein
MTKHLFSSTLAFISFSFVVACSSKPEVVVTEVSPDPSRVVSEAQRRVDALPRLGIHKLEYHMRGHTLTVSGQVESFETRSILQETLSDIPEVDIVVNQIAVLPHNGLPLESDVNPVHYTDAELLQVVTDRLRNESGVSLDGIQLQASNGTIIMKGDKQHFEQIDKILSVVLMTDGVKAVKNFATVSGKPYASIPFPNLER